MFPAHNWRILLTTVEWFDSTTAHCTLLTKLMSCNNCIHSKAHNATCAEIISSNGHSTWMTALPADGSWAEIVNNDFDNIFKPSSNSDGSVECAQFTWATNARPCQCGSNEPWVSCSAASSYCG